MSKKKSRKQRAEMLERAAKRIFYGKSWYSCHAVISASNSGKEARKYAGGVGVCPDKPAFNFIDNHTIAEQKLARELAILMYREAVLAGEA